MRAMTLAGLALLLAAGCAPAPATPAAPADPAAIETAMRQFFGHIAAYDYDGIRNAVTADLELTEDTLRMDTEGFVEFIRGFEGQATLQFELSEFNTEFAGEVAWTSYRLKGLVTMGGEEIPMEWLETVVFRWTEGQWKIDRLQTTPVHDQRQ